MQNTHSDNAPQPERPQPAEDGELDDVAEWFRSQIDLEDRFGAVLRRSIDEVLDGRRTGRYDVMNDLEKTEKTYLGTKVEILVRAEFDIPKGLHVPGRKKPMDYVIAGHQVDSKFSVFPFGWNFPTESFGQVCLLIHANDRKQRFHVGLLRAHEALMGAGSNKDSKKALTAANRKFIEWLVPEGRLPPNLLLHMDDEDRRIILECNSGQAKVTELFRRVRGVIVNRDAVEPIAVQIDMAKRIRDSRKALAGEGIAILGHQEQHPIIAKTLELPVPRKGEWISVRLVPDVGDGRPFVMLAGKRRVVAQEDEEPVSWDKALKY
ncbi:NaeI family type II restriction endonuclease [Glycomyces sp. L485]|uniref:NaeI family type II restriction endonuclease n=1 Tax=Glycomyces sp. L485 TaxID=2909235 RepID=UPI0032199B5A